MGELSADGVEMPAVRVLNILAEYLVQIRATNSEFIFKRWREVQGPRHLSKSLLDFILKVSL